MPPRRLSSLESWLLRVDPSGSLDKYLPDLQDNFDCAEQLVDAYVYYDMKADRRRLDERIFEDLGVEDLDDCRKFEAWFARETGTEPCMVLHAARMAATATAEPATIPGPPMVTRSSSDRLGPTTHEEWLDRIHGGGALSEYLPLLRDNFDCAEQVIEAYTDVLEPCGQVVLDPQLFTDLGISSAAHRRVLTEWFATAAEGGLKSLVDACRGELELGVKGESNTRDASAAVGTGTVAVEPERSPEPAALTKVPAPELAQASERPGVAPGIPETLLGEEPETAAHPAVGEASTWQDRCQDGEPDHRWGDDDIDAARAPKEPTSVSGSDISDIPPPTTPATASRIGMTPREQALRPWCSSSGIPEEVLGRLREEDVWGPDDLTHLEKQDLADIVRGMKKGVQGRFYSAVHGLRKAKGLVPGTPRLLQTIPELNSGAGVYE